VSAPGRVESVSDEPAYQWATHTEPDFLALQLPPAPVAVGERRAQDAIRLLLGQRGFRAVTEDDELGLGAANGCLLTQTGPASVELLVTVGARVGATRFPLTSLDPAWVERVVGAAHVAVLVVDSAVRPDGTTTREGLRRDIGAGGVVGALVPVSVV
jgi:hypothetical protein